MTKENHLKKLEASDFSMSTDDLFRGISNECREPLMRIKGFCELLLSPGAENLIEKQKDLLNLIMKDIEKLETGIDTYRRLYRENQQRKNNKLLVCQYENNHICVMSSRS